MNGIRMTKERLDGGRTCRESRMGRLEHGEPARGGPVYAAKRKAAVRVERK